MQRSRARLLCLALQREQCLARLWLPECSTAGALHTKTTADPGLPLLYCYNVTVSPPPVPKCISVQWRAG